jgi:hypothetical protein
MHRQCSFRRWTQHDPLSVPLRTIAAGRTFQDIIWFLPEHFHVPSSSLIPNALTELTVQKKTLFEFVLGTQLQLLGCFLLPCKIKDWRKRRGKTRFPVLGYAILGTHQLGGECLQCWRVTGDSFTIGHTVSSTLIDPPLYPIPSLPRPCSEEVLDFSESSYRSDVSHPSTCTVTEFLWSARVCLTFHNWIASLLLLRDGVVFECGNQYDTSPQYVFLTLDQRGQPSAQILR